jgi:hypothetical protein
LGCVRACRNCELVKKTDIFERVKLPLENGKERTAFRQAQNELEREEHSRMETKTNEDDTASDVDETSQLNIETGNSASKDSTKDQLHDEEPDLNKVVDEPAEEARRHGFAVKGEENLHFVMVGRAVHPFS